MCGRFTFYITNAELEEYYGISNNHQFDEHYNIAPQHSIPVILQQNGIRHSEIMKWGLIPSWANDESISNNLINARAETLAEKPSFRQALKSRRCIIPISGFYEWKKQGKHKYPFYISPEEQTHLPIAGLWDSWKNKEGLTIKSCTLITVEPNSQLKEIHNRMPAVLSQQQINIWLDEQSDVQLALHQLQPYHGSLRITQVSNRVNSAAYDTPELILEQKSELWGLFD